MGATSSVPVSSHVTRESNSGFLGSPVWAFIIIFLVSFGIRVALFAFLVSKDQNFYRPGGEMGRVAMSLLHAGEFANPYMIPTGPTAHPTPLWPALLALIYGAFGMTATAGYARALVAITSWSLVCAFMPWFARKLGLGMRAGILAGVAGALIPQPWYEIVGHGFTAPGALALGLVMVGFLHRWTSGRRSAAGSLLFGVGCGAAFHVLPPLFLVVIVSLVFEVWWKHARRTLILPACVAVGAALACVPWTWRNYTALGEFCFIRSNFGLELRIANQAGAVADIEVALARNGTLRHPGENLKEARQVRDLGEAEYMRRARIEAFEWIGAHPAEFLRLATMRLIHFWCGPLRLPLLAALTTAMTALALLGLRRALPALDAPGRAALIIPLAAFPLVYYAVSYVEHYPAPLAWMILLLAGYEVQSWTNGKNRKRA
jgi:4-amino-4-deoxy-L-arabinose transferase-like glycosyltransferase